MLLIKIKQIYKSHEFDTSILDNWPINVSTKPSVVGALLNMSLIMCYYYVVYDKKSYLENSYANLNTSMTLWHDRRHYDECNAVKMTF